MNDSTTGSDDKPANQTDSAPASQSSSNDYEAMVQKLAFAAVNEQRRNRRWRIFFLFLTFIYLTPVLLLTVDLHDVKWPGSDDQEDEKHTALVRMEGVIASGEAAGSESVIKGLKRAFEDDDTAAVILQINSPGGSPVQSADIYDEMRRLREEHEDIPLYAVVSDVAASGGYFVASAADSIYVNKSSLLGSIGVRMDSFGLVDMIDKLGVERRLLTAGEHKGLLDPFLPENPVQKAHLQKTLNQIHDHFIDAVKQGRGDRLKDNPELFSGLVWSGEEALSLGLADDYGTARSVARDVIKHKELVDFTPRELLLDRLASRVGASLGDGLSRLFEGRLALQ